MYKAMANHDVFLQDFLEIVEKLDQYKRTLVRKRAHAIKISRDMKPKEAQTFMRKFRHIEKMCPGHTKDSELHEFQKIVGKTNQYQRMLAKKRAYAIHISECMKPEDAVVFLHKLLKIGQNKSSAESIKFNRNVRHKINTIKRRGRV
jgi:hypothetical protein